MLRSCTPSTPSIVRRWGISLAVLGVSALVPAQARAGFSTIQPSNYSSEMNWPQTLGMAYGGTFTTSNGLDYTNGTLTATRVDDSADQIFNQPIDAAHAVYDPDTNHGVLQFGYLPGTSGGTFNSLFTESGSGTNVSGSSGKVTPGGNYRFAIQRGSTVYSSQNSDNPDGQDHMVTFNLTGPGLVAQNWLLGWQDSAGHPSDFNDVVAVQTGDSNAIPLPSALSSGMIGLTILGLLGSFKRVRRVLS